ncbi:unnamed protein product [Rhizoctonia solani]|nr:unnamed protein product [Rhizoctonia solani]
MPRATRSSTKAAAAPADPPAAADTATTTTATASKSKATTKKAPASKKRARVNTDTQDSAADTSKPATTKRAKKNATKDDAADADTDIADATTTNDATGSNDQAQTQTDAKDATPAKSETPEPPAKMVSVLKRGAAPVDPLSPHLVATHQVYVDDQGEIWDAMLNQTDALNNNNKFYVLQLLHPSNNKNSVSLHVRWGRVGENGSAQDKGPWSPAQAVQEFRKQFKSKAGADWHNRRSMQPKKGKYMWLEREYGDDEKEDNGKGKGKEEDGPRAKTPEPTLGAELLDLASLIFSVSLIQAALSEMNYDANKLPLGKLAKSTILSGFTALKGIAEVLAEPNGARAVGLGGQRKACVELTNAYYSVIPHSFGRRHPTIIDRPEILKKELELVDALGDMEIATKIMSDSRPKDADGNPVNPLDANMRSLDLNYIDPVARGSNEWATIANYMTGTHGATHSSYKGELRNLFRVERNGETESWNNAGWDKLGNGEKMLLWHGSRSTNFAGILKQGLRIAPPEAPVTGYMFGKGVYFADAFSKSANYCHAGHSKDIGIMLLCEVAVKPYLELNDSDYYADQHSKDNKKIATKGVGMAQPKEWQDCSDALGWGDLKGVIMPKGGLAQVKPPGAWLQYNEYIVYSPSQIRVRYLLMVDMKSR